MGETNGDNKKKTAREIIENYNGPKVRIMEVCGTHTHEIFRLGIRKLLPEQVELISGPGCPVCVTPVSFIDEAIYLALDCYYHNVAKYNEEDASGIWLWKKELLSVLLVIWCVSLEQR